MGDSPKFRRFMRKSLPIFGTMILLAVINVLTGGFPWSVIPIVAMLIGVIDTAAKIFFADEEVQTSGSNNQRGAVLSGTLGTLVSQARSYKQQVDALLRSAPPTQRDQMRELANQVNAWAQEVEAMARRVDAFKRNTVIQRDLREVPLKIDELKARLALETDPAVRSSLEHTLAARMEQLTSLQKLSALARQAEAQLESTVAALGAIYSQALAMQSTSQAADYSHLAAEIGEQSQLLRDRLEALEEVKLAGQTAG